MTDKLFSKNDDNRSGQPSETKKEGDENERNESYRDLYVGDNKKYVNEEEAFKALHYAQEHIKRLEEENAKTREELGARAALEDMIDTIMSKGQQTGNGDESNRERNNVADEMSKLVNDAERNMRASSDASGGPLTREEIAKMVQETLQQERIQTSFQRNIDEVAKVLENQWGPGYRALMSEKARELGVSQEYLANLAGESPKAFLAAVGATTRQPNQNGVAPPRTNTNSNFDNSTSGDKREWSYYQKMRKENPDLYWAPKTQMEIFQRRKRGEF